MKNSKRTIYIILIMLCFMNLSWLKAQTGYTVSGQLLDTDEQPVMFANVALLAATDSALLAGTISGETGTFELKYNTPGKYIVSVSCIGFAPAEKRIELAEKALIDLEQLTLVAHQTELNEVIIRQERLKAKQEVDKTTYYVNSAMQATSNTGTDMLQHVPGVQVDLLQNVSLNGAENIIILVNGIERDAAFLAQVEADKIDKIEIKSTPGVEYDAETSGVINVVLKENANTGISGHIYANIPTANDEVFSFPTASLNYAFDKLTLYTSYNGGFSYFDIKTEDNRQFSTQENTLEITKKQRLYQQNWSHKLHFGADYFYNENNQLNVYGFVSRFSNEQSGNFSITAPENGSESNAMNYIKDDYDINTSAFASIFYKHNFAEKTELSFDANYYMLKSENQLHLWDKNSETEQISRSLPRKNMLKARLNFLFPLNEHIGINTGFEQNMTDLGDRLIPEFNYTENTSAAYLSANYAKNNLQANAGVRAEYLHYTNSEEFDNEVVVLPAFFVKYRFSGAKQLRFSYKKGIVRPSVFQLNPNMQTLDFYATQQGNPALRPSVNHNLNLDYSLTFGNSFLSTSLFYTYKKDVIETLTSMKDDMFLQKEIHNLGNLSRLGITASGSLKLHKNISVNPYMRLYYAQTFGNELAQNQGIENKQAVNFETSLSAVVLLKHDFSFSFSAQYRGRQTRIQNDYHEDVLYFVSLEKTFFDRLKVGITSAIPFQRDFTYQGYDISGRNFTQTTEDNIQMSAFPVWFKLNYTFAWGKKTRRIERDNSFNEDRPKKGF